MSESFGIEMKNKMLSLGLINWFWPCKGCTEQEIEEVRKDQGVAHLPHIYREFLLYMGRGAGCLFQGSDYTYSCLLGLKEDTRELMAEDDPPFELPEDAFVFFCHGGYHFLYFHTANKDDDPAVYGYQEGLRVQQPVKEQDSLSEFFYRMVRERKEAIDRDREIQRKWRQKRLKR